MTWLILGAAALLIAGLVATIVVGGKRITHAALGRPTPAEARVRYEAATDLVTRETETKANEVKNAPIERKIDRARALRDLGRLRKQ